MCHRLETQINYEALISQCEIRFGNSFADLLREDIRLEKAKSPRGHRFSTAIKKIALKNRYVSNKGYNCLAKSMKITLPSKRTLARMTQFLIKTV